MTYLALLAIAVTARACDAFSTWLITPDLALESNPIVRKLGWSRSVVMDLALCLLLAIDSRLAIPVAVSSLLVASRNCDLSAGRYRRLCICMAAVLMAMLGTAIVLAGPDTKESIGLGFIMFAILSLWFRRVWKRRSKNKV